MIDEYITINEFGEKTVVNSGNSFFDRCIESDELNIFNSSNFQEFLDFKWEATGRNWHLTGFVFHCLYMILLTVYTYFIYILDLEATVDERPIRNTLELLLVMGVLYPAIYDFVQFYLAGPTSYFSEFGNYLDMLYIWASISNTILQNKMNS